MTVNIVTWCCYTMLAHARPHNDVSICLVSVMFSDSTYILLLITTVIPVRAPYQEATAHTCMGYKRMRTRLKASVYWKGDQDNYSKWNFQLPITLCNKAKVSLPEHFLIVCSFLLPSKLCMTRYICLVWHVVVHETTIDYANGPTQFNLQPVGFK